MINTTIPALEQQPFGPKAHLVRLALWELVFMNKGIWRDPNEYAEQNYAYLTEAKQGILGNI